MRQHAGLRSLLGAAWRAVVASAAMICAVTVSAAPAGDRDSASIDASGLFAKQGRGIDPDTHPGKGVYAAHCAGCHGGTLPKAPARDVLKMMAPDAILAALTDGIMAPMATKLSTDEKRQVAEFLTGIDLADYHPPAPPVACTGAAATFDLTRPPATHGWGYDNRRFVPATAAGLTAADLPRLKLKWAFAYPGAVRARSQPVAAMGALFVGSQDGTVYAFDLASGCARWTTRLQGEVRTAIVVEPWAAGTRPARDPRLFLGDIAGNAYALDALTGRVLWKTRVDEHAAATITGAPSLAGERLYVPVSSFEVASVLDPAYPCCTFRGSVVALDTATGAKLWQHYTVPEPAAARGTTRVGTPAFGPSGAPVWTSPTLDPARGRLYHGSGENYSSPADGNSDAIFAVDLATGQRVWRFQATAGDAWNGACMVKDNPNCPVEDGPDVDISASPLLVDVGGDRQVLVVGQKSGTVYGLDPDAGGKLLWRTQVGRGGIQGGVHFGMAAEGARVYVPMVDLAFGRSAERHREPGFPGIHAIDAKTGVILWRAVADPKACEGRHSDCDPGVSAAVTAIPGVVFAGHLDGWLRAYDGATGRVLWSVDTTLPARALNGEIAHGGSMSGPGPLVTEGHVIVNSGYGLYFHAPGNALLVYSLDGR